MARAQSAPILIGKNDQYPPLERVYLGAGEAGETWLQELIHAHPELLPMSEIEPGFGRLIPVAREIPCGHGFIDNLFVTASGELVLVETKLWRNSQMRREVVAQALDYVAALTAMRFDQFEAAIRKGAAAPSSLFSLVRDDPEALDEAAFVDAVNLNLTRGRLVVIVLGDGIRAETEALGELLQSHAGAHFTFALVELAAWRTATGDIFAVPSTLAKTVMIERGIVRVVDGAAQVMPAAAPAVRQAQTLTSSVFFARMEERKPGLASAIQAFLTAIEPYGVYPEFLASLNLKVEIPGYAKSLNLGYIQKNGQFWPNPLTWTTPETVWLPYLERLAALVGGHVVNEEGTKHIGVAGSSAPRIEQFLPAHQAGFVAAIAQVVETLSKRSPER